MRKRQGPDNFKRLPDDTKTRQIIEGVLSALHPVPWDGPQGEPDTNTLRSLAKKILSRADAGKTVVLKPETAKLVATVLELQADGPVTANSMRGFGHRLQMIDSTGVATVLAYCSNVDYAIGAYDAAVAKLPGARLEVAWGGFRPRRNYK